MLLATRFNVTGLLVPAARKLLAEGPKDEQLTNMREYALSVLAREKDESDIALVSNMVWTDPVDGMRWQAFGFLVKRAEEGSGEAAAQLQKIARDYPAMDMRERAQGFLPKANEQKGK
jgi:hypothetical protein